MGGFGRSAKMNILKDILTFAWRGSGKYVMRPRHPQAPKHFVQYRQGPDVDSSGTMPDGREFADIREYKRLLLEDETAIPQALTRLLLSYSLGRRLGFSRALRIPMLVVTCRNCPASRWKFPV